MNILLFFPKINRSSGGVFQYTNALLKTLTCDNENNYYLFTYQDEGLSKIIENKTNFKIINPDETKNSLWISRINRVIKLFFFILNRIGIKITFDPLTPLDRICKKYKIDLLHSPVQSIPRVKIPCIVTLHDVQELYFPEFFSSTQRMNRAKGYKESIDNASAVIVSYEHIRQDIIKFFDKPANEVHVILMEMRNLWFDQFLKKQDLVDISSYIGNTSYILYPAATWQHKNHISLLNSIKILKERGISVRLICTGHLTDHFNKINTVLEELQLEDNIKFVGIVPDDVLYSLYKNAVGVVIPTLYEAGSFPLIEAILMKIPVICSNVTSLPETIGNSDFIFNPYDYNSIANKIEELVLSEDFRERNIENLKFRSSNLINTGALDKIKSVYKNLL
jgi:glycosyltransferase involved in cell wall biosynthesis